MTAIEDARALIRTKLSSARWAELSSGLHDPAARSPLMRQVAKVPAEALSYQIALGGTWVADESALPPAVQWSPCRMRTAPIERKQYWIAYEHAVPLGSSKYHGLPHLPRGMPWPEGLYFAAQLDLAELARVDRSERLPKTGMLYLFFNGALESRVIHWQGSTADLEIREYPEPPTLPDAEHYLSDFLQGETIELRPHWIMHLNEGELFDYRDVHRLLPEELVVELSDKLDAPLASWDCRRRLYGKPLCFQGEDEPVPWRKPETRMVLFQDPFGDAIVHFMCDPEAAARGDFSAVEVTASCT